MKLRWRATLCVKRAPSQTVSTRTILVPVPRPRLFLEQRQRPRAHHRTLALVEVSAMKVDRDGERERIGTTNVIASIGGFFDGRPEVCEA
jgi:hypothetical protein